MKQTQSKGPNVSSARDILDIFHARDESLLQGLTAFRDRLTIKQDERVDVQDERLQLLNTWLTSDPGAQSLFKLWEQTNARQHTILSLIVSIFANAVSLLSSHYAYHSHASPIINTLTSQHWMIKLNSHLATTFNDLIIFTLKLYLALSNFGFGQMRKTLLDEFAWDLKTLPRFLHMRRKTKGQSSKNVMTSPDIRSLFILFLLSFVDRSSTPSVKNHFLEQRRDLLASTFKGLIQDPYPLVRKVLEVCWDGIWSDNRIRRSLKVAVFNENAILQIVRLYDRRDQEGPDSDDIPAEVVHHYLLAICTRLGVGICFKDSGWYPREDEDDHVRSDQTPTASEGSKVYNKILAGVVKGLRLSDDSRQRELALRILKACPELVAGFWSASSLTLEPRLSSTWIGNITFLGSVISEPPPVDEFMKNNEYRSVPPPLSTIIENVLPTTHIKSHLSRGLQSSSPLVQHCTALALTKCLTKYISVVQTFHHIQEELQEDASGLWTRRLTELEREVRRRVPDLQVVIAFVQQRGGSQHPSPAAQATQQMIAASAQGDLLMECSQRLLWLYHRGLPSLFSESRFDIAKLLQTIDSAGPASSVSSGLGDFSLVRQLHLLHIVKQSDQFSWSSKADSTRSNLHALLELYVSSEVPVIQAIVGDVLGGTLATSILFQHDPEEFSLWLDSLPMYAPVKEASIDSESLTVIRFLDDCAQRCMKTAFKYIEDAKALASAHQTSRVGEHDIPNTFNASDHLPSPLLMTVMEQFSTRRAGWKLNDEDTLAIVTFLRRLILRLTCKMDHLEALHALVAKLLHVIPGGREDSVLATAVQREIRAMCLGVKYPAAPVLNTIVPHGADNSLLVLGQSPLDTQPQDARTSSAQLIRRLRLSSNQVDPQLLDDITSAIQSSHPEGLRELFDFILPVQNRLWNSDDVKSRLARFAGYVDSWVAFLHCEDDVAKDVDCQSILASLLVHPRATVISFKRLLSLADNRIMKGRKGSVAFDRRSLLSFLSAVMSKVKICVRPDDARHLKEMFSRLPCVRDFASRSLTEDERQVCTKLLEDAIDSNSMEDTKLLAEYTSYWSQLLRTKWKDSDDDEVKTALMWIRFVDAETLLALLGHIVASCSSGQYPIEILEAIVDDLYHRQYASRPVLSKHVSMLSKLLSILPGSSTLEVIVADAIANELGPLHYSFYPLIQEARLLPRDQSVATTSTQKPPLLDTIRELDITLCLQRTRWTESTSRIVIALIYVNVAARTTVIHWLEHNTFTQDPTYLAAVVYALIDSSRDDSCVNEHFLPHFRLLVQALDDSDQSTSASLMSSKAIASAMQFIPRLRSPLASMLQEEWAGHVCSWNIPVSVVCQCAAEVVGKEAFSFIEGIATHGWKWATSLLTESRTFIYQEMDALLALAELLRYYPTSSSLWSLADVTVTVAIQHHLAVPQIVRFIHRTIELIKPKPVDTNRFLQNIIQHPQLLELSQLSHEDNAGLRQQIIDLLHFLFNLHPANTCQPSHVEPLGRLYGRTLSEPDLRLMSIFRLYETTRRASLAPLLARSNQDVAEATHALLLLDPGRVFRSCRYFPQWKSMHGPEGGDVAIDDTEVYDPTYIILLFAFWQNDGPPSSALAWVRMFRTNAVSLLIRALSSHDISTRQAALVQLAHLWNVLQDADFAELKHVLLVMNLLKDQVRDSPAGNEPIRLPAYLTLHLAHSLRGIFYPSHFTYPLTARHLLQRPQLDGDDVPMLYSMLYSSDDQWRQEQVWIIRFLTDGLVGKKEWQVMMKRHTWDLIASRYQGLIDKASRHAVLELLASITSLPFAAYSLVTKSALLEWIEEQLQRVVPGEEIAWLKIIENIAVTMKAERPSAHTRQEWQFAVSRCLLIVLQSPSCQSDDLLRIVNILCRLDVIMPTQASSVMTSALKRIQDTEVTLHIPSEFSGLQPEIPCPPHRPSKLWDQIKVDSFWIWGRTVEGLWQVAIRYDSNHGWRDLTDRLLLWRAVIGEQQSPIGEWARRQVLSGLRGE